MVRRRRSLEEVLDQTPLFRGLEGDELASIGRAASALSAPRGTVLFQRGDACRGLYVVVSGQVKLALNTPKGGQRVIELIGPGQSFGEVEIFLDCAYVLCAETLADTRLVYVAKEAVLTELERAPGFTRRIIEALSGRLRRLIADLESFTLRSGTERVAGYLLNLVPEDSRTGRPLITLPAAKGVVASRLNLTQEHFSRILHDIHAAGLIDVRGRDVRITDIRRLRAFSA